MGTRKELWHPVTIIFSRGESIMKMKYILIGEPTHRLLFLLLVRGPDQCIAQGMCSVACLSSLGTLGENDLADL